MALDLEIVGILQDTPGSLQIVYGALQTYGLPNVRTVTEDFNGNLGIQVQREYLAIATDALPGLKRGDLLMVQPADDPTAIPESRRVLYLRPKDDDPGLWHVFVEKV